VLGPVVSCELCGEPFVRRHDAHRWCDACWPFAFLQLPDPGRRRHRAALRELARREGGRA
jgi:hypothetical protein